MTEASPSAIFEQSQSLPHCYMCKQHKQATEFYADKSRDSGLSSRCRACTKARAKEWVKTQDKRRRNRKGKRAQRRAHLRKNYGITPAYYEEMLVSQGGKCAICLGVNPKRRLAVDHCHATGKVRSLLCLRCNGIIGFLEDSPTRLRAAMAYLERHQQLTFPKETP